MSTLFSRWSSQYSTMDHFVHNVMLPPHQSQAAQIKKSITCLWRASRRRCWLRWEVRKDQGGGRGTSSASAVLGFEVQMWTVRKCPLAMNSLITKLYRTGFEQINNNFGLIKCSSFDKLISVITNFCKTGNLGLKFDWIKSSQLTRDAISSTSSQHQRNLVHKH